MSALRLTLLVCLALPGCPDDDPDRIDPDRTSPPIPRPDTCATLPPSDVWRECRQVSGFSVASQPGQLAVAPLTIKLGAALSERLAHIDLAISAYTGQALPGAQLALKLGDQLLQTLPLAGPHANLANFRLQLGRELCPDACELRLTVSGPPVDSDVPIPIELAGTVVANVPGYVKNWRVDDGFHVETGDAD